jgi:hypothetical protein
MFQTIALSKLKVSAGTQPRAEMQQDALDEYAAIYTEQGVKALPDLEVFLVDGEFILVDGFHRYYAALREEIASLPCNVRKGTMEEALKYALGANRGHGVRRTNADKRKCVELALDKWPKNSDREIAEICGVEHHLVSDARGIRTANSQNDPRPMNIRKAKLNTQNASGGTPTASPVTPKKPATIEKSIILDDTGNGTAITPEALPFWNRKAEIQALLTQVSEIKCLLEKKREEEDPMYAPVSQSAVPDAKQLYFGISQALPYAVCTVCQGTPSFQKDRDGKGGCSRCKNTGLISKDSYNNHTPQETKNILKKVGAKNL